MMYRAVAALFVFITIMVVHGCHSPQHSGRKKRQSGSDDGSQAVDTTRDLRDYFASCLLDVVGTMQYDWDGVVDYTILDTLWYEVSEDDTCSTDTVQCWKDRLEVYLDPDSDLLQPSKDCIDHLAVDVAESGQIQYRGREKRQDHQSFTPEQLLSRYSSCVDRGLVFPSNRRALNLESVIQFIEDHAICGECNDISLTNSLSSEPRDLSNTPSSSSSSSSSPPSPPSPSSSMSQMSGRSLISSLASSYVPFNPTPPEVQGCSSIVSYPFIFQGLTRAASPLIGTIESCNQIFRDILIPNPCSGLINLRGDDFCNQQQSWCDIYQAFMLTNCARTCCEKINDPIGIPVIGWTPWTPWGECPAPCGLTSPQARTRLCPLGVPGITPCTGIALENRVCAPEGCPSWSEWGAWSACSITCGATTQTSVRTCNNGQQGQVGCIGQTRRSRTCNRGECLGTFTDWTAWSTCTASCAGGSQSRSRRCVGGFRCESDQHGTDIQQFRSCNERPCPGRWSDWGAWNSCTVTCGGLDTYEERNRTCLGGKVGGPGCGGQSIQRRECGRRSCPDPTWAHWSTWSECVWRRRVRECVGGDSCPGEDTIYEECERCNVHPATWLPWGPWGRCLGNCSGLRRRRRVCDRGNASPGHCIGPAIVAQSCRPDNCFIGK